MTGIAFDRAIRHGEAMAALNESIAGNREQDAALRTVIERPGPTPATMNTWARPSPSWSLLSAT